MSGKDYLFHEKASTSEGNSNRLNKGIQISPRSSYFSFVDLKHETSLKDRMIGSTQVSTLDPRLLGLDGFKFFSLHSLLDWTTLSLSGNNTNTYFLTTMI